jgi:hypothetical protein
MADEFDRFLADALAPETRAPDRAFVAHVQARVVLDERLKQQRQAALRSLGVEVLAIIAVAAGLVLLTRAQAVAGFFIDSPAVALAAVMAAFAFLVVLFTRDADEPSVHKVELQVISNR